jgi:hypothetical protein
VTPNPRNTAVSQLTITFNQAVSGFDLADLQLTRNGGSNLLTGAQTLTTSDNITWTLGNLAGLTAAAGNYVLNLTATSSGITDTAGNALTANASTSFTVDTTAPTAVIASVTPNPRNTAVSQLTITFSEAVAGFDLVDLQLTRNGGSNLLTGAQTLTTSDNITWTLGNLSSLTGTTGTYTLALTASGSLSRKPKLPTGGRNLRRRRHGLRNDTARRSRNWRSELRHQRHGSFVSVAR